MNESKELIDRYVYDTVRRLPEKQRKEIEMEIRSLISDTMEEKAIREEQIEEIKKMLIEIGSPKELAKQYQDNDQYLIGPSNYESYKWTLKIIAFATTIGMLIANLILPIIDSTMTFDNAISNFLGNYIDSLVSGFAIVTVIFACIEKGYIKYSKKESWNIDDLPKVSSQKSKIKRGSVVAGIVFTILVIILFNFYPQLMGMNIIEDGKITSYPIFNLEALKVVLPIFNIAMLLGIIRDIAKTIEGRYTKKLAIFIVILNVVAMVLSISAFLQPGIINGNIIEGVIQLSKQNNIQDIEVIKTLFENFDIFFLNVLGLAFLLDSAEALYKAYKADK